MGSALSAVTSVATPFLGPAASAIGGLLGLTGGNSAQAQVNSVNPQLGQIQKQQLSNANNFNSNMQNFENDQINAATDASRLKTTQQQRQNNTSANARGMLYGSYGQNQNNQTAAANTNSLNNQISGIDKAAINTGQDMNNQAINNGLVLQGYNQDYNNAIYNTAMDSQKNKAGGVNGLIQAVGSVVGM